MSRSPKELLEADVRAAMKAGQRERLLTLRLLLTDLNNKGIEARSDVDEATFYTLVQRSIKQRRESAEMYGEGGRDDLAEKEIREIGFLEAYLPKQVSDDEIREQIAVFVAQQSLEGPAAIGTVMKEMMPRFSGGAEGSTISRIAKEILLGKP
jgi:uncharacterized protein YqeY